MRPRWDDPSTFGPHLPPDYTPAGVFADGPQPPRNPLTKLQAPAPSDARAGALPAKLARAVLTMDARRAGRLKLSRFSHRPKPPQTPQISAFRLDVAPPEG